LGTTLIYAAHVDCPANVPSYFRGCTGNILRRHPAQGRIQKRDKQRKCEPGAGQPRREPNCHPAHGVVAD
ncbi:MAG: hypothetical protein ACK55Z_03995, partial [bacterium]